MTLANVINSPLISWQGRWSAANPATCIWGASVMLLKTDAPKIVLRTGMGTKGSTVDHPRLGKLEVPCVIYCRAGEGEIQRSMISAANDIVLYDGPSIKGGQVVELVFGALGGRLELDELLISEGYSLFPLFPTPDTQPRRLLFIGASQTTGASAPDIRPPPLPYGSFTGWPLLLTRDLRSSGKAVFITVVARPGIPLVEGTREEKEFLGMDKRFWDGWEGVGAFGSRKGGLEAEKVDVIFISIGSNDISSGVSAADFLEALKGFFNTLVARLSPSLRHIVFVAPFGFHSRSPNGDWNRTGVLEPEIEQMIDDLSNEWGGKGYAEQVWYVRTAGWVDGSLCPDMLHPNEEGNRVISRKLREWCDANIGDIL